MVKTLTDAAVARYRGGSKRREIPDAKATGLHLIIQPSGAKSYALRFRRPDGTPAKLTLGPVSDKELKDEPVLGQPLTLAAARALATDLHRQRKLGRDIVAEYAAAKHRQRAAIADHGANTFASLAHQFIEEHAKPKTRRWRDTARFLGLDYPDHGEPVERKAGLIQRWGDRAVVDIHGNDIHAVILETQKTGVPGLERRRRNKTSDTQARSMAAVLSKLFSWLLEQRHIYSNPALGMYKPAPPKDRKRVLNVKPSVRNADELRWFWAASAQEGEPFTTLLRLLLLTGCRLREISEMQFEELDDNLATLHLPGKRTKNHEPCDVYLPPLARDMLANLPKIENCPYVFPSNGNMPLSGFSKVKARLDAAMLVAARKERGDAATVEPWRLHDLRRTCATGMAGIGIAPHIVEAALNHLSGVKSRVAGIYNVETYEPEKRTAWERWAAHVEGIVSGKPAKVIPLRSKSS